MDLGLKDNAPSSLARHATWVCHRFDACPRRLQGHHQQQRRRKSQSRGGENNE